MRAQDKPKFVKESRKLFDSIDIDKLIDDPNELKALGEISRLIAIFTNFSYNDGQELRRLLFEFQKWARRSSSTGTIRNRATDMLQFISQKIEEMDIYVIEEPIKRSQDRIIKNLKNEKFWIRSSLEGKDLHVIVGERGSEKGEHVHVISDSETGAIRYDDNDQHPSELLERVVSLVTKGGATIGVTQSGIKTTMEFFDNNVESDKDMPILYPTGIRRSGGPNGHFEYITIKNIGKNIALDINWGMRAFAYEWKPKDEPFELEPGKEKEVTFPISEERIFSESIPELNVIMEYKDADNKVYFTRRELKQLKVKSGTFYELKAGTFYPPSILVDDGLRIISDPISNGDRVEATFKIDTKEGVKQVKIGLSRSLIATLGFDNDELVKQAILELAHRLIRKMVKENNLNDHMFSTYELPEHHDGGFEAYIKLRDSII